MSDMIPQGTQYDGVAAGHDNSDINIRALFLSIVILTSSTIVVVVAMAGMFGYLRNREAAKDIETPPMYAMKVEAQGKPLVPSLIHGEQAKANHLPWDYYILERQDQYKEAADTHVFDPEHGVAVLPPNATVPGMASSEKPLASPFTDVWKWEAPEQKFTAESTGGAHSLSAQKPISSD